MSEILRMNVTLRHVVPKVTRRLEVRAEIRLDRLHQVLQSAMGWTDSHLWSITIGGVDYGLVDPDWEDDDMPDASRYRLDRLLVASGAKSFRYLYDFGDGWEHTVRLGAWKPGDPRHAYPRLLAAAGACPPEDVGGPWGYADFLAALDDPEHEEHEEYMEWGPENLDPEDAEVEALQANVDELARAWRRG